MVLRKLFRKADPARAAPQVPDGLRIYAIGDIHGRVDLLSKMIELIVKDLSHAPVLRPMSIFLGDYIDRGPDSYGVLELMTAGVLPTEIVTLRGNHELMLLDFLSDPARGSSWGANGGLETLHSYGVDVSALRTGKSLESLAEIFQGKLPPAHLSFVERTELSCSVGDYFFCHAGIRPGVALEAQHENDLLWIRDDFLRSRANHGKVVVHGHTPVMEPESRTNRINIDTGAFISGTLTCLVLEGSSQRFIAARLRD